MEPQHHSKDFHTTDQMYATQQNSSPFTANVSSYFRRPTKVVKSTSRNTSPRHTGRRKTTTNVSISRTRSLLDRHPTSIPHQSASQQHTRPLSWHPNSQADFNFSSQDYIQNMTFQNYFQPVNYYGTTSANGLFTPMSYAIADEPQIQELITPLEELSAQEAAQGYNASNYSYQWMQPDMSKPHAYAMDNMFPQTQPQQTWQWDHETSMLAIPTAPASPNFLPIQGGIEASPLNLNTQTLPSTEDDGEELVGMGLYDSPADVRTSSLLVGGGFGGSQSKRHLKLEESFEPAPDKEETGESDDQDDDGSSEDDAGDDAEDNPVSEEPTCKSAPFSSHQEQGDFYASTLAAQSFYFDSDQVIPPLQHLNTAYMHATEYQPQYQPYGWI